MVMSDLQELKDRYQFVLSEMDVTQRAATELANALNDIHNEIGEWPEIYRIYSKVERIVDRYKNIDYDRITDDQEDFMNEIELENEIQKKGLTAPRITPDHIESVIVGEDYHVFPGTTVTVCCLELKNGYNVLGESACASPENFDRDLGMKLARDNAKNKIWQLEGYALREKLSGS